MSMRGASVGILNEIVYDINRVNEIYANVNNENAKELHDAAVELEADVNYKYLNDEEKVPEFAEEEDKEEPKKSSETDDEDEEDKKKSNAGRVIAALTGLTLLAGGAYHTGSILHSLRENDCDKTETVEESESNVRIGASVIDAFDKTTEESKQEETTTATETTTAEATTEETKVETPVENMLVAGEYGTFFDVNDPEQVQARAQYIFDTYFAKNPTLTEQQKKLITVDNIANTIRIMNGNLALDENGYEFFDGMTLNQYTETLVEAVVNVGSNDDAHYTYFPGYLLFEDDSEESEFVKSYSVIYDKLVYALNAHDDEQVQDAIACLGFKFYYEWYLQGMYGDTNPHLFRTDLKYLTFITTIEPYNTTAEEWHLSELTPVCIEVCKNPGTNEMGLISVNDLQEALETGAWNNIGAKLGGMDVEPVQWLAEYYDALNQQLSWKYDHRQTRSLNK